MIDETNNNESAWTAPQSTAFCQDCGTPLTPEQAKRVGGGVFCEPCLQKRAAVPPPPVNAAPGAPHVGYVPNPTAAGWLGLIPGVGAMYNGQFYKGFAHIVIFVVLVSFKDHVSDVFGLLVLGFIVYQVFDAVHTARARRDGTPVPDYLNLNNIGERFGHNPPYNAPPAWAQPQPGAPTPANPEPVAAAPAAPWTPVPPAPPAPPANASHHANWAGYIPPAAFSGSAPYTPQPTAIPYQNVHQGNPLATPVDPTRGFPVWAVVFIALGVFFLLVNVVPSFHISGSWIATGVLVAVTAYSLVKRTATFERMRELDPSESTYAMIHEFRTPLFLAVLSVMFALQALHAVTLGQTWPVILVVLGIVMFADRALQPKVTLPPPTWTAPVPPPPTTTEEHHG